MDVQVYKKILGHNRVIPRPCQTIIHFFLRPESMFFGNIRVLHAIQALIGCRRAGDNGTFTVNIVSHFTFDTVNFVSSECAN